VIGDRIGCSYLFVKSHVDWLGGFGQDRQLQTDDAEKSGGWDWLECHAAWLHYKDSYEICCSEETKFVDALWWLLMAEGI
jgi:hypothetical protein